MITQLLVQDKVEAFGERMMAVLNEAALALMASIGHRTGLFDTMARMEPATSERIAAEANLSERYVREWLGAMVTAYVVEYDPQRQTYRLPPEHAAWLTRAATPQNVAASMQFISVLGGVEDLVVEAFRHGRGVPYSAYKRFYPVMAEESAQTVVSVLFDHILPLVPGLRERLEGGIDVMDVGCGSGWALIEMAAAFPRSRFTGVDLSEEGIADGRARAQQRGLTNIELLVRDAATGST